MMTYGYTIDHISPERMSVRARSIKPFPRAVCAALIVGTSVALWAVLFEAVKRLVM